MEIEILELAIQSLGFTIAIISILINVSRNILTSKSVSEFQREEFFEITKKAYTLMIIAIIIYLICILITLLPALKNYIHINQKILIWSGYLLLFSGWILTTIGVIFYINPKKLYRIFIET